jgi:2,3-bisphosphoglycerate-independent phosphoglycerate mutase
MTRPVVLVVLDGFGIGEKDHADATAQAHLPFFTRADRDFPHAQLETSGESVGLPPGQMGNSEVGHMTMGAGRIIDQDLTRINKCFDEGGLATNEAFNETVRTVKASGGRLHLWGLLSDGGVHSHNQHIEVILRFLSDQEVPTVVHAILDGRDTPPSSGLGYVRQLLPVLEETGARVATVSGRYYSMDRDNRWDRIQKSYDAMVQGEGLEAEGLVAAVQQSYDRGETDEFMLPTIIGDAMPIQDGDAVVCFNFRSDRARELTNALTGAAEAAFGEALNRHKAPTLSAYLCFTEYDQQFGLPVAFPKQRPEKILAEVLSLKSMTQLRIAETEKYAHVTFFFGGGREQPFPGEDRVLISSPQDVATYDHKPEMSAMPVTEELLRRIETGGYDFILINYANPDMVGHTGVLGAAEKAIQTVDHCLDQVTKLVLAKGGTALITADHGNCELMIDPETGEPHTAHTTNPVPIWWVTGDTQGKALRDGTLADLAPTVLGLLELDVPDEMTGKSLLQ